MVASSAPLVTGVPAADCAGLCKRERAGVCVRLPFGEGTTSSMTTVFPWSVSRPFSTFHISGPGGNLMTKMWTRENPN